MILSVLFLSIGSALGAILRMIILEKLEKKYRNTFLGIYCINTFSTFLLGYIIALENANYSIIDNQQFLLFFKIGFLGSFSTFSSFIFEIILNYKQRKYYQSFYLSFFSVISSIISGFIGYKIVYAS